jgi:hypothetical protein
VLVVLAVIRSAVATRTDGFTIDDAYHITAGVSYVKLRDFRLNPEHPPLVKLWAGAALAPGFHLPPLPPLADKFAEREFNESVVFLENDPMISKQEMLRCIGSPPLRRSLILTRFNGRLIQHSRDVQSSGYLIGRPD